MTIGLTKVRGRQVVVSARVNHGGPLTTAGEATRGGEAGQGGANDGNSKRQSTSYRHQDEFPPSDR